MRTFILVAVVVTAGCDSGPKMDDTMNQMPAAQDYPAGPYGYVQGSVIENIVFLGKNGENDLNAPDYASMSMKQVALADFHRDTNVKYIVLSGVAGWCKPCNDEQAGVPALMDKYVPKGFRFFEAMIQGYSSKTGAAATEMDLNRWADYHSIKAGMGLDPEDKIHQYADIAAFPLNMVVRTSDMQIVHMQVGQEDLDPVLADLQ